MAQVPLVLARRFSVSATANQMVKAPIQVFGIEGRYASALYSAATKEKQLDVVEKDLKEIQALLKKKGRVAEYLLDPSQKRNQKRDFLLSALGTSKASKLTTNLLGVLAENGRLKKFEGVANMFAQIMAAHRGEISCEVVTAKPLDAALQQELEGVLKSFLKSGQVMKISTRVDPSIVGGMIVSIGDRYVDMSTASKVKKYSDLIKMAI